MNDLRSALGAYGSVIRSQQEAGKEHEPTATEYFAVSSKTLGKASEQSPDFLVSTLRIMEAVIPQAAKPIVRGQFKAVSTSLLEIITQSADEPKLLRVSMVALGTLLCAQDMSDGYWGNVQPLQCLNTILIMLEDSNAKLRKVAEDQIMALLRQHKLHKVKAVRAYVADFCFAILKSCTRSDYRRSLYIVLFLESSMALLATGENRPKQYLDTLLSLQTCQQAVLTAASFRTIDAYFQSPHYDADTTQTAVCYQTLVETRNTSVDMEANTYRYLGLGSGFVLLHKMDARLARTVLKKTCQALTSGCEGEFLQIHDAVGAGFKRVIGECINREMVQEAIQAADKKQQQQGQGGKEEKTFVGVVVHALEELLQIKYKAAWLHVLGACKKLLEAVLYLTGSSSGGESLSCGALLAPLVRQLAGVYQLVEANSIAVDVSTHLTMGETLGAALRCVGFTEFLQIVPLRAGVATPDYMAIDTAREWLLPLLHSNLKLMRCSLCDYAIVVLPMVEVCRDAVARPADLQLNSSQVALIKARIMQLLSLFPDFCHLGTSDLVSFFPRLLPELTAALQNESKDGMNSAQHILTGIAQLANVVHEASGGTVYMGNTGAGNGGDSQDLSLGDLEEGGTGNHVGGGPARSFTRVETPEFKALSGHAHTVLPAILSFLERSSIGDPSFASAVRCVSAWTSVAPTSLVTVISKKLLQLLLQSTTPNLSVGTIKADAGASWMAITLAVVPYLPAPMIHILYKTIRPLLSIDQSISSQKRAYSVLEAVLTLHGDKLFSLEPREAILEVVNESLMSAHVSARNMRLRCILTIVGSICSDIQAAAEEKNEAHREDCYGQLVNAADATFGETLICQKDANQKTRDTAKNILSQLVLHLELEPSLARLASAIVAETPVMRSAAILGLCVAFVQHRGTLGIAQHFPSLLSTTCLLLQEENAEVSRAVLTFIKVCCAVVPVASLEDQLPRILSSFCQELGPLKAKFATRCKALMRKLLQRFGESRIRPLVPQDDLPLLEYLLRQGRRKVRRQGDKKDDLLQSDDEADEDGEDSDGDEDDMDVAEGTSNKKYSHVRADHRIESRPKAKRSASGVDDRLPTSLTDLLEDQGRNTAGGGGDSKRSRKRGREDLDPAAQEAEVEGDDDEKYHVVMENGVVVVKSREDDEGAEADSTKRGKLGAAVRVGAQGEGDNDAVADAAAKASANKKKRTAAPGAEYKSKKSGGDVWRKGTLEPHAYIPLDARLLAGRNSREAMSTFGGVVNTKRARASAAAATAPGHVVVGNRKQREARNKRKAAKKK